MQRTLTDLWKAAAELSEKDRADLAALLIESLERDADPDVESAWAAEVERRMVQLDSGAVKTVSWEEVRRRLLARLNEG